MDRLHPLDFLAGLKQLSCEKGVAWLVSAALFVTLMPAGRLHKLSLAFLATPICS